MTILPARANRPAIAERILEVASGLFFREGIRAVGIDRIIAEADIAKATLYRHFPSKEDLVLAYRPRQQIAVIFERLSEKAGDPEFRGCAFALAVAEHGEAEKILALARLHKREVAQVLTGIARAAALPDHDQVGSHLALLYDGALARRAILGDARPMHDARAAALTLFVPAKAENSEATVTKTVVAAAMAAETAETETST
jgi:AcrR family transcriptional regulator